MTSFVNVQYPSEHLGVVRAENALAALKQAAAGFDGARGMAALLLAAMVSALLVFAQQVIDSWAERHQWGAWLALGVRGFGALALLGAPTRRGAPAVRGAGWGGGWGGGGVPGRSAVAAPPKTTAPGKPRCGTRASWPRSSARWTVAARSTRTAGTAENSGRGLRQRCGPGGGPLAPLPGPVLGGKCPDFCIRHIAVVVRIRLVKSGRQAWKEPDLRAAELAVAIEIQHFEFAHGLDLAPGRRSR